MKVQRSANDVVATLRTRLLRHYDRKARDLPWRGETDPYRIWVSEVMLQQTRVETVTRYYEPWLQQFPDVGALADAPEDRVLKAWEGLGYYRRARGLHRAASVVRDRHDGRLPSDPESLMELPGVGRYTAGAIASIAFGVVTPAVDGNVKRVLARLYDEPNPTARWLEDRAAALVHPERPGDWNQALMELGATICIPRAPRCTTCPVSEVCAARAAGTEKERPAPTRKAAVRVVDVPVLVAEHNSRVLLAKRPPDGLLGGMWAFPEGEVQALLEELGLKADSSSRTLAPVQHRFTHLNATYRPLHVRVRSADVSAPQPFRWVGAADADELALPVAQRKIFDAWVDRLEDDRS